MYRYTRNTTFSCTVFWTLVQNISLMLYRLRSCAPRQRYPERPESSAAIFGGIPLPSPPAGPGLIPHRSIYSRPPRPATETPICARQPAIWFRTSLSATTGLTATTSALKLICALFLSGVLRKRHKIIPRGHNNALFLSVFDSISEIKDISLNSLLYAHLVGALSSVNSKQQFQTCEIIVLRAKEVLSKKVLISQIRTPPHICWMWSSKKSIRTRC